MRAKQAEKMAESDPGRGFQVIHEAVSRALQIVSTTADNDKKPSGITTGIAEFDGRFGGIRPKEVMLLGGRFGVSGFYLRKIAYHVAAAKADAENRTHGPRGGVVGFYSLTMSSEDIATRIIAEQARLSERDIRVGDITEGDFEKLISLSQAMQHIPFFIDETNGITLPKLAARARRLKRQRGLDVLVLDSIQALSVMREAEKSEEEATLVRVIRGLRSLARELNIAVIAGFEMYAYGVEKHHSPTDVMFLRRSLREQLVDHAAIFDDRTEGENLPPEILDRNDEATTLLFGKKREPLSEVQGAIDINEYVARKFKEWDHSIERMDQDISQFRSIHGNK